MTGMVCYRSMTFTIGMDNMTIQRASITDSKQLSSGSDILNDTICSWLAGTSIHPAACFVMFWHYSNTIFLCTAPTRTHLQSTRRKTRLRNGGNTMKQLL